jgi:hypothetical protein
MVERVPLLTARAVPGASIVHQAGTVARFTLLVVAAAAAVLGSLRLVAFVRRRHRRRRDARREGRVA